MLATKKKKKKNGMLATILSKPREAKLDQHVISFIHRTSSKAKKTSVNESKIKTTYPRGQSQH